MFTNGIVIQDARRLLFEGDWPYRGTSCYESWPLDTPEHYGASSLARELTDYAFSVWFDLQWEMPDTETVCYPVSASPELSYSCRYINECIRLGIEPRVLLCESDREVPQMEPTLWTPLVKRSVLLGFDLSTSRDLYSALLDDFWRRPLNGIEVFGDALNDYGLIESEKMIDRYAKFRQRARGKEGGEGDFLKMRLSAVEPDDVLEVLRKTTKLSLV